MTNLRSRIDRLARSLPARPTEEPLNLDSIMVHLEGIAGQGLPRSAEAAAALGFQSVAEAAAAACGMTLGQFKEWLHER